MHAHIAGHQLLINSLKFISTADRSSKFETEAASSKAQTQSLALAVDTKWSAWNNMPTMPEKG